jgi:Protein of unknown function (DUF1203)
VPTLRFSITRKAGGRNWQALKFDAALQIERRRIFEQTHLACKTSSEVNYEFLSSCGHSDRSSAVRQNEPRISDPRFPAHQEIAAGRALCGHGLEWIGRASGRVVLFTYDPFREVGTPPLAGPVYLHREECARSPQNRTFPEAYQGRKLTFDAYGANGQLLDGTFVAGGEEEIANRLFDNPDVRYIHVRSREAGVASYFVWSA